MKNGGRRISARGSPTESRGKFVAEVLGLGSRVETDPANCRRGNLAISLEISSRMENYQGLGASRLGICRVAPCGFAAKSGYGTPGGVLIAKPWLLLRLIAKKSGYGTPGGVLIAKAWLFLRLIAKPGYGPPRKVLRSHFAIFAISGNRGNRSKKSPPGGGRRLSQG